MSPKANAIVMDSSPVPGAEAERLFFTEELLPELYRELRRLAGALVGRERSSQTLGATALVHEAYLRLGSDGGRWQNRAHFYGAASIAMRRILVEKARRAARLRHGGEWQRVTLIDGEQGWRLSAEEMLALDSALESLAARDDLMARIVELRFFVGLTIAETAEVLGLSSRSVDRGWKGARAWLYRRLRAEVGHAGA